MPYRIDTRFAFNAKVLDFDGEALIQLFLTPQELYAIEMDYCPEPDDRHGDEIRCAISNLIRTLNADSMESYGEKLICPFEEGSAEYNNYQTQITNK